jgi:antitoxin component of MazEF toxin-antitoxin module
MQRYITRIRRNGGSTITAIPPELVQALGLEPSEHAIEWERDGDTYALKFLRVTKSHVSLEREERVEAP